MKYIGQKWFLVNFNNWIFDFNSEAHKLLNDNKPSLNYEDSYNDKLLKFEGCNRCQKSKVDLKN